MGIKATTESDVLRSCIDLLRLRGIMAWRSNNTPIYDPTRKRFRKFVGLKGVSDILGILNDGRLLAIEVKKPGGKPSQEQTLFLEAVRNRSGVALLVDNAADLDAALKQVEKSHVGRRVNPSLDLAQPSGATFSECGTYRYLLWRYLSPSLTDQRIGVCAFIMLNPSTADAAQDDPTIRRCLGFVKQWGNQHLLVANLFALRATDPREIYKHAAPVGPENDQILRAIAQRADRIVCAWGAHGRHRGRDVEVRKLLRDAGAVVHHFGLTKNGCPKHPLYLRGDTQPERWDGDA